MRIDATFFQRWQKPLLRLANTRIGRRYWRIRLGMEHRIMEIMPNRISYDWHVKDGKLWKTTEFRTGNGYALRLGRSLRWLRLLPFVAAGFAREAGHLVPAFAFLGATVTDFFPDANAVDGRVQKLGSTTWASAHDATDGDSVDDTSTSVNAPTSGFYSGSNFFINRLFVLFDTSSLPDTDTISAATLSLWFIALTDADNDGNDFVSIVTSTPASNTALAVGDFDQLGTTEQHDAGQRKDLTSITTGAYTTFTLNATGIGNISKTGVTKFGAREGHDLLNDPYAGAANTSNNLETACRETAGTSNDPKLTVTHAAAATATESNPTSIGGGVAIGGAMNL